MLETDIERTALLERQKQLEDENEGASALVMAKVLLDYGLWMGIGHVMAKVLKHMAHGSWPVACGLWPVACGLWPVTCTWPLAHGPWPLAHGPWPAAYGVRPRRPVAYGLRPVAGGLRPQACVAWRSLALRGLRRVACDLWRHRPVACGPWPMASGIDHG